MLQCSSASWLLCWWGLPANFVIDLITVIPRDHLLPTVKIIIRTALPSGQKNLTKGRIAGAPQNCPLSWRDPGPPDRLTHGSSRVDMTNSISIGSAVLVQFMVATNRQTDGRTHTDQSQRNLGNNRPCFMLCMAMRPNNNNNIPFPAAFHGSAKRKCGFFPQHHGNRVNCRCNQNFVCLA